MEDAEASSINADSVEKKTLYHFYPGSYVFSFGTISCNFHCKHCQNWGISTARWGDSQTVPVAPEEAVMRAKATRCSGNVILPFQPSSPIMEMSKYR